MYAYAHAHQIEREVSAAKKKEGRGRAQFVGLWVTWLFYVDEWEQEARERQAAFGVKGTRPLPFVSSSLFFP